MIPTPTKVLVSGDTHGDVEYLQKLCRQAVRYDCEAILVLGDWGYLWPGDKRKNRLESVHNKLAEFDKHMFFLDGNHEWFDELARRGATTDAERMVELTDRVTYLPRGFAWDWHGVRFMSLGGAVSVDKDSRTPGSSWWPEETITHADVERAISKGEVDIVFSHDTVDIPERLRHFLTNMTFAGMRVPYKMEAASASNRRAVTAVVEQVKPKMLMHGHYHHCYTERWTDSAGHEVDVVGLNCNDRDGSWAVLNIGSWAEENLGGDGVDAP